MENSKVQTEQLTEKQLIELLKKKQQERKKQEKTERQEYEQKRDALIEELVYKAEEINKEMTLFKHNTIKKLEEFRVEANKYGDIRSNSKGGFSLRTSGHQLRIMYRRNTKSEYDERAAFAEQLLKEFLEDTVKKRDLKTFKTINALLSRNKENDFNPVSINSLLAIEDNWDDPRWIKALKLFKESFNNIFISMSVEFSRKDEQDKDISIPLTFSSLKTSSHPEPVEG